VLAIDRLTRHYGALVAIQDVSFEARPGEVLGLLGPNGSGKSTTVKILTGLLRPTSGAVRLDGADALADLQHYKSMIGYVPEEPHLYSYLTGPEYLRLVGRLRGVPERALDDKIDRFLQLLDIYDEVGVPAAERRLPDAGVSDADIARWLELAPRYGLRVVGRVGRGRGAGRLAHGGPPATS